jgi:hypothetical protein
MTEASELGRDAPDSGDEVLSAPPADLPQVRRAGGAPSPVPRVRPPELAVLVEPVLDAALTHALRRRLAAALARRLGATGSG